MTTHVGGLAHGFASMVMRRNSFQGGAAFRGDICGPGAVESASRPQSPRQQAMLVGHLASAPFSSAGQRSRHGLPPDPVHLAGVAPFGAGFVTGNEGQ